MERRFRNAVYRVEVTNPDRISRGTTMVLVDGEAWTGTELPYEDGRDYEISVQLVPEG
ncbi:hypothetical protein D3C80_1789340 [compost metagenome]